MLLSRDLALGKAVVARMEGEWRALAASLGCRESAAPAATVSRNPMARFTRADRELLRRFGISYSSRAQRAT
jgi:hypothetical protein